MAVYSLYFKLSNHSLPFKKVVSINAAENLNVFGLLDIANLHLCSVGIMAAIQVPNEMGDIESKTVPMRLKRVEMWQYMEEYRGYVAVTEVLNNPLPFPLHAVVILREEKCK